MTHSAKAKTLLDQVNKEGTKLGDLRKISKEIKKDHDLAMELWAAGEFMPRQLAILIMDKKLLNEELIDHMILDLQKHESKESLHLADWLMANQLSKDKKTIALMMGWEDNPIPLKRRLYWYYQARLRWTGKIPIDNADLLLESIENKLLKEQPEVQWAMNFTAAQIGIFESKHRARSIAIGEKTGLYKDEEVPRGCTPNYLPEFIKIQVEKMKT